MTAIQVSAQNNATFARSLLVAMPGYALPLVLSSSAYFLMQLRSTAAPAAGALQQIALAFDSRLNSIGVIADDSVANTVTLAFLASAQDMSGLDPAQSYIADLLYVAGGDVAFFGTLQFTILQGATLASLPPAPAFASIASWPPLVDLAGASPATILSVQTQGLPGPIPWGVAAPWAAATAYQANPPASLVTYALSTFVCVVAHESGGAFDPSKWQVLVDATGLQTATAAAAASALAAGTSAGAALTAQEATAALVAAAAGSAAAANASAFAAATTLTVVAGALSPANLAAALIALIAVLPTSSPGETPILWNDGGVPTYS